ncbi:Dynamin-related protein 5A [Hibiscus syriacus]|uniref:Dynamin-related protein 5A n=1 Tax=Hibiscus syriacus TaxID=106335 RepID=A0A6A2YHZ7_HIBSY|nr:Dynamin-related protein 5A [Hibiscus syriacus]
MGVEIVGSNMAQVAEVDKSFLLDKENVKLDNDPVHKETMEVVSSSREPDKGDGNNASNPDVPTDAVDEWPAAKQIHSIYFVRCRLYDDPEIKAKIDQADKELQKWNRARFKITEELKAKRSDRAELLAQVRALNVDFDQFKEILGEKKKEIESLQQALGKLRTNNYAFGGLCSSEEELNAVIHCLQYHIQHESIPLAEEKQLLREIKRIEGTRETVITNEAIRAKIQDSMGQKEAIQDQLMGVDLNGVRKEQHAVQSKKKLIKDKLNTIEKRIDFLQEELKDVTEKRDKAYEAIQELRKQRDEEAKIVAAKKDIKALEELAAVEVCRDSCPSYLLYWFQIEKFMALWNGNKAFRDDYEKRILSSLDSRQLSRDGQIRNPDEKPLVTPEVLATSETETISKLSSRQPKEEAKSSPQPGTKKRSTKHADTKVMKSKSSPENAVAEKEISGSGKSEKDTSENNEDREKKARKKSAASKTATDPEEPTEPVAGASESDKADVNSDVPVPAPVSANDKVQKENNIRYRNRTKGLKALPRAILRRIQPPPSRSGGQSDGKISLLEALLGFRFNVREVEMSTRRPFILQMVHDPSALEPRCRFQEEDSEEYGISPKPIVMRAEFAHCPNLTIIDTPGFVLKAKKGEPENAPEEILSMVKSLANPPHLILLFLQQSSVEWCSSLWLDSIREIDPTFRRTIIVVSKFDNRLKGVLIDGAADHSPEQWGKTTEEERSESGLGSWPGVSIDIIPANAVLRLYGGAALKRVMHEFRCAAYSLECPSVSREKVAIILLANAGRGGGRGVTEAAAEITRTAARSWLAPLLDTACDWLSFVLVNLFDIALERNRCRESEYEKNTGNWDEHVGHHLLSVTNPYSHVCYENDFQGFFGSSTSSYHMYSQASSTSFFLELSEAGQVTRDETMNYQENIPPEKNAQQTTPGKGKEARQALQENKMTAPHLLTRLVRWYMLESRMSSVQVTLKSAHRQHNILHIYVKFSSTAE